ncbi:hypothetical protein D7Y13_07155 [Corallococcus praedator]|uniref:Uma2 family endonuclease n=2 Tax=Myxococcaceae TaxID=31 RepID=A0ABX9QMP3_9BACT|nr:hypothetical protein D7X75_01300 [Corallococcus sp. CA031C]RKI13770.1 hypothetical protein D7Y13_07155 [Corallococcus praedator]
MVCHPTRQECITPVIRTRLRALRATLTALDPSDDSDWDLDGSPPDVVVELTCPQPEPLVSLTEEIESLTPQWTKGGCDVLAQDLLAAPIQFRVIDVDAFFDDEITVAQYQLTQADLDRRSVDVAIPEAVTSLVFQLDTYLTE